MKNKNAESEFPEGKFMSTVKVGPKGQIVIPKEVRELFGINPGDRMLLVADINRGIAFHHYDVLKKMMDMAFEDSSETKSENAEEN